MLENLFKNWIVYLMLGGFVWFVVYLAITSRKQQKKDQKREEPQK